MHPAGPQIASIVMADADRNPTYLRDLAGHVAVFRDAFVSLLELHTPTYTGPGIGIMPAVQPLDGADEAELEARRTRVSEAAGRARRAPVVTGVRYRVQGYPDAVDPIAAWATVTRPRPLLEPADIIDACNQMIGTLEALADQAEAELPPTVDVAQMHAAVWSQAARLWRDGHYRQAVQAASDGVVQLVKSRTGRNDAADTALWQQAFSKDDPQPGKPRLRWPGDQTDQTVKSMNEGLRNFAPGTQMTIRNPATHGPGEMTQQEAVERLSVLSLLARHRGMPPVTRRASAYPPNGVSRVEQCAKCPWSMYLCGGRNFVYSVRAVTTIERTASAPCTAPSIAEASRVTSSARLSSHAG
jgi:uncharacterized protein (TIGR02391 family)